MRVTNITLNANEEEVAEFAFRNPKSTGTYVAKAIVGLDADEIVPKFYGFSLNGKTRFFDRTVKKRDVVMRIALNPRRVINETYSDLREEIYKAIASNRTGEVELHFYSGATLVAYLVGYLTKIEVPHTTKTPEMQITIHCDQPFLRAVNPVRLEANHISAVNPVVIADSLSTAPHGFKFVIRFTAAGDRFTIQDDPAPTWKFDIFPGELKAATEGEEVDPEAAAISGFQIGDELHFSSDLGEKYLTLVRNNITYPIVDKIQLGSIWPVIFPGANKFHIIGPAFTWVQMEYYAAYWGV